MEIKQFYDQALAHSSYAIASGGEVALVDPARDPRPYLNFAREQQARIVAIFETHPHADFVSSHREFAEQHGATIYINSTMGASYPHQPLDDGNEVSIGNVTIRALFTPGHSPDHNSYLLLDEHGSPHSVYTGDSLFVGDVGRPDLREGAGHLRAQREELAQQMYHTIHGVFALLEENVVVYPAHGAGSLCGKNMGPETSSTIGKEKAQNWAFTTQSEDEFVTRLLENAPFVPLYFPYDVELNREGAPALQSSLSEVPWLMTGASLTAGLPVIDVRTQKLFKRGHVQGAINIQEDGKWETWLGALIAPSTSFYLMGADKAQLERVIHRAAKIGYESHIKGVLVAEDHLQAQSPRLDIDHFTQHPEAYTIVDIRNTSEAEGDRLFAHAVNIPLPELSDRLSEIDIRRPVVVHCAGGYRSAAGSSLLEGALPSAEVYDLSDDVKKFQ